MQEHRPFQKIKKKPCNMNLTAIIQIVIGALVTVSKGLVRRLSELEMEGRDHLNPSF